MKIAVSAEGTDLNARIDPRFGRAAYFIIIDTDTGKIVDVIDNRSAFDAAHGAGINAATVVAQAGAEAVLTGRVGPKAYAVLDAAGIKVISEQGGTVAQALDAFTSGGLIPSDGPDGDGHPDSPNKISSSGPMGGGPMGSTAAGPGPGSGCRRQGGSGRGMGGGGGKGRGMGGGGRGGRGCGCGRK